VVVFVGGANLPSPDLHQNTALLHLVLSPSAAPATGRLKFGPHLRFVSLIFDWRAAVPGAAEPPFYAWAHGPSPPALASQRELGGKPLLAMSTPTNSGWWAPVDAMLRVPYIRFFVVGAAFMADSYDCACVVEVEDGGYDGVMPRM
jgi:hypothetical protein